MMRTGHALTGVLAGVLACTGAGLCGVPLPVRVGVLVLPVAGVFLPDIDSPRATITRVLGPLGWALHHLAVGTGKALFRLTRTEHDEPSPGSGHRLITHTLVAAVGTGIVSAVCWLWLARGLAHAVGAGPGVPAGVSGALGGFWWLLGAALGLGHAVGIAGDALTVAGVPMLWPLKIRGKRWFEVRVPLAFHADGEVEHLIVYPVLYVAIGLSLIGMFGGWGYLFTLLEKT